MANHLDLEEQEQLDQLKHFWNRWGNLITWVLIVVLGAFAAWNGWNWYQRYQGSKATIAYVQTPVGATDFRISTYFADVGDVSAIQLVNQAQLDYVKNFIATSTDATLASYKNIPVISCSAPFKAGRNGPSDFTDVTAGATPAAPVVAGTFATAFWLMQSVKRG